LIKADTSSEIDITNATIGYIVIINGVEMIIHPKMERYLTTIEDNSTTPEITHLGFFELKENNTLITDLRFKYPTTVSINYEVDLEEIEDISHIAHQLFYYYKPGQLYGSFDPNDSLMKKIYNKYFLQYKKYYQRLLDVTDVQIEGPQGTVVYIKDSKDEDFNRHILENGFLQLKDPDASIEGIYFGGVHLIEHTKSSEDEIIRDNEYIFVDE